VETGSKVDTVAIVGPTASGKSDLALRIAAIIPSEIICADSRTIYKGMNIGTAKPADGDRSKVPHWGLDILEPGQIFSAKDFQVLAKHKLGDIHRRKHLALLVGGTGLYIDSVLYNFSFTDSKAAKPGQALESLNLEELRGIISKQNYPPPENLLNKRHLIRTIERRGQSGGKSALLPNARIIGLLPNDGDLRQQIGKRADEIFSRGVLEETEALLKTYGEAALIATGGIVYKICVQVLNGEISKQTAIELFKTADWQYARRQRTWFKRNKDIRWFEDKNDAFLYLQNLLNT
jgi:tRNA dimethylallyltransferase